MDWYRGSEISQNEDHYSMTLTMEAIQSLPKHDFIEFFYKFAQDGGMVQTGGSRTASRFREDVEEKFEAFREFVLEPFNEPFDEIAWLSRTNSFFGLGPGLSTIYLNRLNKRRFAIVNNKAAMAIELLGVHVPVLLTTRYRIIRDAEAQLIEWYPEFDNFFKADALTQFLIGEEMGKPWADRLRKESEKKFWIYAAGERSRLWEQYLADGVMGIGWNELNMDLSGVDSEDSLRELYFHVYGQKGSEADFRQLYEFLFKMCEGDHVFVKRGISQIIGYGEVVSGHYYDSSRDEYRHLRKMRWTKNGSWNIPEGQKTLPQKTLTEIKDPERLADLLELIGEGPIIDVPLFTDDTFELLAGLHENPTASYYTDHEEDFKSKVEEPLQRLMEKVAQALPPSISGLMETEKNIFARIPKNDYGRGGAWDFYWGAFYPKEGTRISDIQLYVTIFPDMLGFGFYVGDSAPIPQQRFMKNCADLHEMLEELLGPVFMDGDLVLGEAKKSLLVLNGNNQERKSILNDWISDPSKYGIRACIEIPKAEANQLPATNLIYRVTEFFKQVFPLFILAQYEEPLDPIRKYLSKISPPAARQKTFYSPDQLAEDVHMDRTEIDRWFRAVRRKRQVIFYGPPGTGKTFIAQHLARALIAEGDGFCEMLQFHPSYAYEDFMQGLRPRALKGGGLEYTMVPGRFRDFCARAAERKDTCVLIIDEINRANLSRVFGELMYLLEYREESIPLVGGEKFQIPVNAVIIGTMNTADKSIALFDQALRRRFAFLGLYPNYDIIRKYHSGVEFNPEQLIQQLEKINEAIGDRHYSIGVSFFLDRNIVQDLKDIWQMEIEPYLEELFFDQVEKAEVFSWDRIQDRVGLT